MATEFTPRAGGFRKLFALPLLESVVSRRKVPLEFREGWVEALLVTTLDGCPVIT